MKKLVLCILISLLALPCFAVDKDRCGIDWSVDGKSVTARYYVTDKDGVKLYIESRRTTQKEIDYYLTRIQAKLNDIWNMPKGRLRNFIATGKGYQKNLLKERAFYTKAEDELLR